MEKFSFKQFIVMVIGSAIGLVILHLVGIITINSWV